MGNSKSAKERAYRLKNAAIDGLHTNGVDMHLVNDKGENAVMRAAENGYLDVVKYLHANGADIHAWDNEGNNVLARAGMARHGKLCAYLLDNKADMNFVNNNGEMAAVFCIGLYRD